MATLMALNYMRNSSGMNGTYTEQLDVLDSCNEQRVLLSTMGAARLVKIYELITFKPRMPPRKRMCSVTCECQPWDKTMDRVWVGRIRIMSKGEIIMQHEFWSKILTYLVSGINVNPYFQCTRDLLQWPVPCSFNNVHLLQGNKGMHYTSQSGHTLLLLWTRLRSKAGPLLTGRDAVVVLLIGLEGGTIERVLGEIFLYTHEGDYGFLKAFSNQITGTQSMKNYGGCNIVISRSLHIKLLTKHA